MRKNVIISIRGRQSLPDFNDIGELELVTAGHLVYDNNNYMITYPESALTGLEGSMTTLLIGAGQVTMMRTGEVRTHMVFEQGHKHLSLYNTEEGSFTVGVSAHKVRTNIGEHGGELEMEYALEIDHSAAGENRIQIQIRESGETGPQHFIPGTFVYDQFLN